MTGKSHRTEGSEPKALTSAKESQSSEQKPAESSALDSLLRAGSVLGNRRLRALIQTKLRVGSSADSSEREADSVSAAVLRGRGSTERTRRPLPPAGLGPESQEERAAFEPLGSGRALTTGERAFFEPRFQHDFSAVRIHSGPDADGAARSLDARAFTLGRRVVLDSEMYSPGSRAGQGLLAHELTHVVQQTLPAGQSGPVIRRALAGPAASTQAAPVAGPAPAGSEGTAAGTPVATQLIVEEGTSLQPGQMVVGDFVERLRTGVCEAADQALAGTRYTAQGCPWVQLYLRFYAGRSASKLQQDISTYVPESAGAATAEQYVGMIATRVRQSVAVWVRTGEISGVPAGLPTSLPGLASVSRVLFKSLGGTPAAAEPAFVRMQLGEGRPLSGPVRGRMESAIGRSFGHVRVHTDAQAARLSSTHQARAFTVGEHVAFGPGEYRPGTPIGDALLAHELAHVAQQGSLTPASVDRSSNSGLLEQDADHSAVGAVVSLYQGLREWAAELGVNAMPRLRSGLRLQRCDDEDEEKVAAPAKDPETVRLAGVQRTFMDAKIEEEKRKEAEKKRREEIEKRKKAGEKDPKVPKPKDEDLKPTEKDRSKIVEEAAKPKAKNSTDPWLKDLDDKGRDKYKKKAAKVIKRVKKKAKSNPDFADIAKMLDKAPPIFNESTAIMALENGWFGWATGDKFSVSMSWIEAADKDERNVFANIAHEVGGHIVFGKTTSLGIAQELLDQGDPAVAKSIRDNPDKWQAYYMETVYPETEIYGELRERRWVETFPSGFKPTAHTDLPNTDIPAKLQMIKAFWAPEVGKVVLTKLVERARKDSGIRKEDVDFLLKAIVDAKMGFTIK